MRSRWYLTATRRTSIPGKYMVPAKEAVNRLTLWITSLVLTLFLVSSFAVPAAGAQADQAEKVISISIVGPSHALKPNQTFQLNPRIVTSPKGTAVKVVYSSTNPKAATVVGNGGLVTAVSPGKAVIYISAGGKTTYTVIHIAADTETLSEGLLYSPKPEGRCADRSFFENQRHAV